MAPHAQTHQFSGVCLRELRKAQRLSREELAVATRRSYATIVAYETGKAVPPGSMVGRLADVLDASPGDFYIVADAVSA